MRRFLNEIVEAPQILAITLERYNVSDGGVRRQDGRFTFPLDELDLTELVCRQQGRRRTIYEPLAIIVHSGSVDSGHYHALVREDEGSDEGAETTRRWLAYDDSSVRAVRTSDIPHAAFGGEKEGWERGTAPAAYMMFYQKRRRAGNSAAPVGAGG